MNKSLPIAVAAGLIALASVAYMFKRPRATEPIVSKPKPTIPIESVEKPKSFIEKNAASTDKKVQTHVTRARMTLAYQAANNKNYTKAKEEFLLASQQHKGTEAMHPEFGTLTDQAKYQAIVCLEAEGKKDDAIAEYRKFMIERKESPLVHMCHRRLERIFGTSKPEDDILLQNAITAQENRIKFETSVCGPKVIEKILPLLGKPVKDYKEIAKLANTTDEGTTVEGMRDAFEKLGIEAVGLEVNAPDFRSLKTPVIWLRSDHYVAILSMDGDKVTIYDSRYKMEQVEDLPKKDDASFRATVLTFDVPTTDLVSDHQTKPSK